MLNKILRMSISANLENSICNLSKTVLIITFLRHISWAWTLYNFDLYLIGIHIKEYWAILGLFKVEQGFKINLTYWVILFDKKLPKTYFKRTPLETKQKNLLLSSVSKRICPLNSWLKPHAKSQNHRTTPSGRKVTWGERKKEREKRKKGR